MNKVTRIAYSHHLTPSKWLVLQEMARRLGQVRAEVWRRYGSIAGVGLNHRQVRDLWMTQGRTFDLPARLWKETLRDVLADIKAYREAAKVKVRQAIWHRTQQMEEAAQTEERKRLYGLLKSDCWLKDSYLRRMMRKYFKHGRTTVQNQIVLDTDCYKAFSFAGRAWLEVTSLIPRQRIAIPLKTTHLPQGTLRLILRGDRVEVHYTLQDASVCSCRPCGEEELGVDAGYTEVFTDSKGRRYGTGLGQLLAKESDFLSAKNKARNKLRAIAQQKPQKRKKIEANNLGRKKLDKRREKHEARVKDKVYQAVHQVVNEAKRIVAEDLRGVFEGKKRGKKQNRRLSGWVRGVIMMALMSVCGRRGASLMQVNCAYTSQMDSRYGVLLGSRVGDRFYCFDGEVLDADTNAARNILGRVYDEQIVLYTPHEVVKTILQERTGLFQKRLGLLNPDSSCTPPPLRAGHQRRANCRDQR